MWSCLQKYSRVSRPVSPGEAMTRRLPVSQVACEALQASLASPAPPSPIPGEHGAGGIGPEVRRYLARLVLDLEHVRSTLDKLTLVNGP